MNLINYSDLTGMCNGHTDMLQLPDPPLFILQGGIKHDCVIYEWSLRASEGIPEFLILPKGMKNFKKFFLKLNSLNRYLTFSALAE